MSCTPARPHHDADGSSAPTIAVPSTSSSLATTAGPRELSVAEPGFVGTLRGNSPRSPSAPSEYCLDDGMLYTGATARLGALNVFATVEVEPLIGQLVLVRGAEQPSLLSALTPKGPCPAEESAEEHAQMRSDWVSPEGGFRATRDKLAALPFLRAHAITPLSLGGVTSRDDTTVVIELQNPFAAPLDGLEATAHYEGGPGKPMSRYEPLTVSLPPGGKQRLSLSTAVEAGPAGSDTGTPRGTYWLETVELRGKVGALHIDASLPVLARRPRKR